MAGPSTQTQTVQRMYDARASSYDESFHPAFTQHIVESLSLQPGERLLDLACGTGLITLRASKAVGPTGAVVGIDLSDGMLAELQRKIDAEPSAYANVTIRKHDITKLDELTPDLLVEESFDAISLASALPLLQRPGLVLHSWNRYLKPGGRIIVDSTDATFMPHGIAMERVYNTLGLEFSSNRLWSRDGISLRQLLQQAGYEIENVWQRETTGAETMYHGLDAWEPKFEDIVKHPACHVLIERGLVDEARQLFKEEWANLADQNSKIKETCFVWVGLARKPRTVDPITARGSCACGKISWSTTIASGRSSSNCHCVTCRKISGSPYITFVDIPLAKLTFSPPLGYPYLKTYRASPHAERGFCGECGSTLTMWYRAEADGGGVAAGTLDEEKTVEGWYKGPQSHIYLKDVPGWYQVPEDGKRRNETMLEVERLLGGGKS